MIAAMHAAGCRIFVEVGPHPTLLGLARRCLPPDGQAWLPSLRKGADAHARLPRGMSDAQPRTGERMGAVALGVDHGSVDSLARRVVIGVDPVAGALEGI